MEGSELKFHPYQKSTTFCLSLEVKSSLMQVYQEYPSFWYIKDPTNMQLHDFYCWFQSSHFALAGSHILSWFKHACSSFKDLLHISSKKLTQLLLRNSAPNKQGILSAHLKVQVLTFYVPSKLF